MPLGEPLGPYVLTQLLGMGGLAEVYRAQRPMLDHRVSRVVAIKRLHRHLCADPVASRHLLDEALISLRLQHPNIVQTFEINREGADHFLVMELVEGPSLSALLTSLAAQGRLLPLPATLLIVAEAAAALSYAHTLRDDDGHPLQLIHLDLSPDNLLLSRDGYVKLIDFGLARAREQLSTQSSAQTRGRARYLSPERAQGLAFDHRADLFSLGLILWQLLTGQHPLADLDPLQALSALQRWHPPSTAAWQRAWPPALLSLLARLLAARPQDRTPDAATLQAELCAILHALPAPFSHPQLQETLARIQDNTPFPLAASAPAPSSSHDPTPTVTSPAPSRARLQWLLYPGLTALGVALGWLLHA
jgi:eukaryotic-like serine/threonine-protein kinase